MTSQGHAPDPEGSGASSRPDVVDLDALRAERLEQVGSRVVRFGGREWDLVAEVPFEFAEAWAARRRTRCAELVLADASEAPEFMALRPSLEDFNQLLNAFGTTPGKSRGSSST